MHVLNAAHILVALGISLIVLFAGFGYAEVLERRNTSNDNDTQEKP